MDPLPDCSCYAGSGFCLCCLFETDTHKAAVSSLVMLIYFWLSTVIVLTAGTLFVMWMGELGAGASRGAGAGRVRSAHGPGGEGVSCGIDRLGRRDGELRRRPRRDEHALARQRIDPDLRRDACGRSLGARGTPSSSQGVALDRGCQLRLVRELALVHVRLPRASKNAVVGKTRRGSGPWRCSSADPRTTGRASAPRQELDGAVAVVGTSTPRNATRAPRSIAWR